LKILTKLTKVLNKVEFSDSPRFNQPERKYIMNTFSAAVSKVHSEEVAFTENGMKAFATSDSTLVDLFGKIGSNRGRILENDFVAALAEDENLAVRILLWARDVREGAGERAQFRGLLSVLEKINPALAGKLMFKIPELGRWDDLFVYADPINRRNALRMYADALMDGNKLSAKWAPRLESSKRATTANAKRKLQNAKDLAKFMMLSPKEYRQLLSRISSTVENQMCAKQWNEINFSHVPSVASARYQKAFGRNAGEAYSAYIRELQKPQEQRDPKAKVNAGAVYPYDVVKSVTRGNEAVANAQWDALPNYMGEAKIMPMVDVSGSMSVQLVSGLSAMDVAVSLGLYLSDKAVSDFKDMFITFTRDARIQVLKGSLSQKIRQIKGEVGYDTNLASAFDSLLITAKRGKVAPENMPSYILVLSDMQFNASYIRGSSESAFEMARRKYADAGYKLPQIIFWNLAARASADQSPVKMGDNGVCMVSGFSPSIMTSILSVDVDELTPWNMMLKTIMKDRYDF
jgi:hypothetical protein